MGLSPNVGTHDHFLIGVTTVLANDVWAVGAYNDSPYIMNALIEHWNGSHWSIVTSPNGGGTLHGPGALLLRKILSSDEAFSASTGYTYQQNG